MCLLVLAWKSHPHYRLVVAANRDEFHDRPAAPLAWWSDGSPVLAGRDLAAGGTWLGVTRAGRFGAVTNFREPTLVAVPDAPSRGGLVPGFLAGAEEPVEYLRRLRGSAARYAGFNVIAGGSQSLCYYTNRSDAAPRELEPGIYGLANHELDAPWPKLQRARERFAAELGDARTRRCGAVRFAGGSRARGRAGRASTPACPPEMARAMSAPFVLHPRYGTRCSTVLLAGLDGRVVVAERRFDSAGRLTGATRLEFAGGEPR